MPWGRRIQADPVVRRVIGSVRVRVSGRGTGRFPARLLAQLLRGGSAPTLGLGSRDKRQLPGGAGLPGSCGHH